MAETITVDMSIMPRVVFTGDSQTCGCVGAMDYPQILSWELPLQIFNRAVGGSNTRHLVSNFAGGSVEGKQGEKLLIGTDTSWFAGPHPGQKVHLGANEYTIDRIVTTDYRKRNSNLWLTEPLREDFSGEDYIIEAGWQVRLAAVRPQYAVFMFSVNDVNHTSQQFKANLAEIVRRCREAKIQPFFLTGVPLMDPESGGSHPPGNGRTLIRIQDMNEFCAAEGVPFGDVFSTLMLLDDQRTSVWVDTVHPTNDGSLFAMQAVRRLFEEQGLTRLPYYVHGFRAATPELPKLPDATLKPWAISQPRYSADGRMAFDEFDLNAIYVRDEDAHLAAADGDYLMSTTPVVLQFGVGDAQYYQGGTATVVVEGMARVSWYNWRAQSWQPLVTGAGKLQAKLPPGPESLEGDSGRLWLAVQAEGRLKLDYAGLEIQVKQRSTSPGTSVATARWPEAGQFDYPTPPANLLPNGDLAQTQNDQPLGFTASGPAAQYLRAGAVAKGNGDFVGERTIDQFRCPGQEFTQTVRPLDMLEIKQGPEGCTGRFLISSVADEERLVIRRYPESAAKGLDFEVHRSSGCLPVPGGHLLEARGQSAWQTTVKDLAAGWYEIAVFYRAFEPEKMDATHQPGNAARWTLTGGLPPDQAGEQILDSSYVWQRVRRVVQVTANGSLTLQVGATSATAAQFTGFSVVKLP